VSIPDEGCATGVLAHEVLLRAHERDLFWLMSRQSWPADKAAALPRMRQ
jgi:hypothetical protein